MGIFHASVVMIFGFVLLLTTLFVVYISTGLWEIENGVSVMVGFTFSFMVIIYPIVSFWLDVVDKAYRG